MGEQWRQDALQKRANIGVAYAERQCHSGICHDCCKCRSSIRGRPRKQDIQPVASPMAVLIRDQPHRSCATKTNAISVEGLSEEIHESPLSSHSREHIFNILHLLDVSAENDVLHLPSVEQRQSATVKEDFMTSDGFRRVQSLFWKGVKGWIKILLPSWSLPQDKVLNDLFQLPSGPFEDMHVDEVDASHDHSEDKVGTIHWSLQVS